MSQIITPPLAVVTGAGQGMGQAIARRFAASGFAVALVGRTLSKLETTAAQIQAQGGMATSYELDVTDPLAIQKLAQALPQVDCLVNCAGESLVKSFETSTLVDWDLIINTNLKAPFMLIQALLPQLRHSMNPTVINIGSKTSLGGFSHTAIYSAAKTGLLGLTRALAAELRPDNMRIVMIAPGPADTPMRWSATPDFDPKLVIDTAPIAETVYLLATLPRGVTTSEFLLQSSQLEN